MNLFVISARVAASGYDFRTKMKINMTVAEEIARESGIGDTNMVFDAISDSDIHKDIQQLANSIHAEAQKLNDLQKSMVA